MCCNKYRRECPAAFPTFFLLFIQFQHTHKCLLWDLYAADLAHPLLSFFLLLQKLLLSGNIAAVTLGQDILSDCLDRLPGDDLAADGCLDGNLKEMSFFSSLVRRPGVSDWLYCKGSGTKKGGDRNGKKVKIA